jgi:AraC-like DNA-binding protein
MQSPGLSIPSILPKLAHRVATLAGKGEGFCPSPLKEVRFMRAVRHIPRTPVTYEPSIVIIAQGRKQGHLDDQTFTYDSNNYLVLSIPLPFECETFGSPEKPLLGVSISVTAAGISELLLEMEDSAAPPSVPPRGVISSPLTPELGNAVLRLLDCMGSAEEARILGPLILREITYRALQGEQGAMLRALAAPHSNFGQITRILKRIHTDYSRTLDVSDLARDAGMSVSTFHAHFKTVTSTPPLQYIKSIRLHKARMLMVHEGETAGAAALRVGYESASQFSREFKRFFGGTPAEVAGELRAALHNPEGSLALY